MLAVLSLALAVASVNGTSASPACWIRGDRADSMCVSVAWTRSSPRSGPTRLWCATVDLACLAAPSWAGWVPFGEPWRLGANEATTLTVSAPVLFGDIRLAAGSYSLYAVPEQREWRVIVNRVGRRWGIPINDTVKAQDIGSVSAAVEAVTPPVEEFRIQFEREGRDVVDLVIEWDRTRVRVPIRRAPT